jgi:hypothetical protein
VVPAFRKELNDVRQKDIERNTALRRGWTTRRRWGSRAVATVAGALQGIADRLEPAADHPVETRRVVFRHS